MLRSVPLSVRGRGLPAVARARPGPRRLVIAWLLALAVFLPVGPGWAGGELDPASANTRARAGALTLVDIRGPAEWRRTGVPTGALRIDQRALDAPARVADALLGALGGDHDAPIALLCSTGGRSALLRDDLELLGFTRVYVVTGGVSGSQGWLKQGMPVTPCPDC